MKNLTTALLATFLLTLLTFSSLGQSVGINNAGVAPDASALLDLNSTNKGFLITRVDTANINSPAFGLMTLSPKDSCLYLYNGSNWAGIGGGGSDCSCNCGSSSSGNEPPFKCGDRFTDARDNETYGSVQIKDQCWMSENLNYTPNSGDFWCYDNDPAKCDAYGRLYRWATLTNSTSSSANPSGLQGLCPTGWHIPSDAEWMQLEMALGMSLADANTSGWRGANEGVALKTSSWGGNNSTGFTALSGGYRTPGATGVFYAEGMNGFWWSSTQRTSTTAYRRYLGDGINNMYREATNIGYGASVRCIKD